MCNNWKKEQTVSTKIKTSDLKKLKEIAINKEISVSNLIRNLILELLSSNNGGC